MLRCAQQFVKRAGARTTAVVGMLIASVGLYWMSRAGVDGSYVSNVLPAIVPMSIGMGLTFVPITLIATTGVADEDAGLASGLFNTAQQVGGALGLAVLSTLATARTEDAIAELGGAPSPADRVSALVEGFDVAFTAAAILVAASGVILLVAVRRRDVKGIDPEAAPVPGA